MNSYRKGNNKKKTKKRISDKPLTKKKDEGEIKIGTVIENLPNAMFRVQYSDQEESEIAYLAGKMKLYRIRVLVGDQVEVKIDPYGGKGRIVKRLRM